MTKSYPITHNKYLQLLLRCFLLTKRTERDRYRKCVSFFCAETGSIEWMFRKDNVPVPYSIVQVDDGLLCGADKFGISTLSLAGTESLASLN